MVRTDLAVKKLAVFGGFDPLNGQQYERDSQKILTDTSPPYMVTW